MNCMVMVDPSSVPGDHVVFLSGDDADAKDRVRDFLATLGWRTEQMFDLGGIETAVGSGDDDERLAVSHDRPRPRRPALQLGDQLGLNRPAEAQTSTCGTRWWTTSWNWPRTSSGSQMMSFEADAMSTSPCSVTTSTTCRG